MRKALPILLLIASATGAADRVITVDGQTLEGTVRAVSAQAVDIDSGGRTQQVPLADVGEIVFAEAPDLMARDGAAVVICAGGTRLAADGLRLAGGQLSFGSAMLGPFSLPIGSVREILLPGRESPPSQVEARCRDLWPAEQAQDAIILRRADGNLLAIEGILNGITAQGVAFRWKEEDRDIPLDTVLAIRLPAATTQPRSAGVLIGRDGSVVEFASLSLDGAALKVAATGLEPLRVDRAKAAVIRLTSQRVVPLADLPPATVKEHGFLDWSLPHRRNRSVGGGPLTLDGKTYSAGLGLHSFCELTYRLDGQYVALAGLAGIDDAMRPRGDATLTFLADGKPLGQPIRLTGTAKPVAVRLDLTAAKELTVRVEFGEDKLDVSDHVDLVDARLIRKP